MHRPYTFFLQHNSADLSKTVLAEVQKRCPRLELWSDQGLSPHHLVSLGGASFLRNPEIPVGPGDHVVVMDAASGG